MYRGKCLCAEVQIELTGAISEIIHCHCSLCRKNSGTAYATNGFINTAELKVTQGESLLTSFTTKPGRHRHFCSKCGSPVYSSNEDDPSRLRIRLGILDLSLIHI